MNLYNFLNRNTTGFLTNFLSEILKGPVKFVEYEEITRNSNKDANGQYVYGSQEVTIKVFKFGLNGEVFELFIIWCNRIALYFHSAESVRLNLLSILSREYKINKILK